MFEFCLGLFLIPFDVTKMNISDVVIFDNESSNSLLIGLSFYVKNFSDILIFSFAIPLLRVSRFG